LLIAKFNLYPIYLYIDAIDPHHQQQQQKSSFSLSRNVVSSNPVKQQSIVSSLCVNNTSINNNYQRQASRSSIHASKSSVETQWKTAQPKQSMSFNMMPRSTSTSITGFRYPVTNNLSNNIQQFQQQSVQNASSIKTTGSSLNSFDCRMDAAEPCRNAFELMSTRVQQSQRNRNAARKNNSTVKR
jgi:hypothetical protein